MVRPAEETRDEVDDTDEVEAEDERRPIGAGVGARLRMDSDLLRLAEGCAWALLSGWKRVEVSKWTGMLAVGWFFCFFKIFKVLVVVVMVPELMFFLVFCCCFYLVGCTGCKISGKRENTATPAYEILR